MSVSYATLDGEILSVSVNGVRQDLLPDPLGSVAVFLDETQTTTVEISYWPYGEERTRTGTTTIALGFGGAPGYYGGYDGSLYVRARILKPKSGRWLNVDPLWPSEKAFDYASSNPTSFFDASGLSLDFSNGCSATLVGEINGWCSKLKTLSNNHQAAINRCMDRASGSVGKSCPRLTDNRVTCLRRACNSAFISCIPPTPGMAGQCPGGDRPHNDPFPTIPYPFPIPNFGGRPVIILDGDIMYSFDPDTITAGFVFVHEIAHSCGITHNIQPYPGKHRTGFPSEKACNNIFACCVNNVLGKQGKGVDCAKKIKTRA